MKFKLNISVGYTCLKASHIAEKTLEGGIQSDQAWNAEVTTCVVWVTILVWAGESLSECIIDPRKRSEYRRVSCSYQSSTTLP